jgi:hypothetical protein
MTTLNTNISTSSATANREDLSNTIYNIDPADTPVSSAIGRRTASNITIEWQTEALPAVDTTPKAEGRTFVAVQAQATARVTNTCQINDRVFGVTGSQEAANAAGKRSEVAHQTALFGKALKRDIEVALCSAQAEVTSGVRQTRALEHWIQTNDVVGASYVAPANSAAAQVDGTARPFTEALLISALQLAYENGGEPSLGVMGPFNKRTFSGFAGRAASRVSIEEKQVLQSADFYLSDFGEIKMLPSRWVRGRTVLLLDPEYAKLAFYRPMFTKQLPENTDGEQRAIIAEWGVEVSNERAHAAVKDLTVA